MTTQRVVAVVQAVLAYMVGNMPAYAIRDPLFAWRKVAWPWKHDIQTEDEVKVAFAVHPMGWSDLMQSVLSWLLSWCGRFGLTSRMAMWLLAYAPVIENAEVTGIQVKDGRRVRIITLIIPFLPWMIKEVRLANELDKRPTKIGDGPEFDELRKQYKRSKWFRDRLWNRLKSTAIQARRRGCRVLGLGALLSSEFNGGADLQKWCNEQGLDLIIDNGAAYTAVTTVQAAEKATGNQLDQLKKITVIGGSGFVGRITARYLEIRNKHLTVIGRDEAKLTGFAQTTIISTALEDSFGSDLVMLLTSSPVPVVTLDICSHYDEGTTFLDAGRPVNFDSRILAAHPEKGFRLVRCGVTRLPGTKIRCGMDFHFGWDGSTPYLPACVAQAVMVALGGEDGAKNATTGARVSNGNFEYFAQKADEYGITVYISEDSEGELFEGKEFPH